MAPSVLSVLKVPPILVYFIIPLVALELLSVWFALRCFRWEEGGGCFLLSLCLHFPLGNRPAAASLPTVSSHSLTCSLVGLPGSHGIDSA